jgi:hypothetical protein
METSKCHLQYENLERNFLLQYFLSRGVIYSEIIILKNAAQHSSKFMLRLHFGFKEQSEKFFLNRHTFYSTFSDYSSKFKMLKIYSRQRTMCNAYVENLVASEAVFEYS